MGTGLVGYVPSSYPTLPNAEAQYFTNEFRNIATAIRSIEANGVGISSLAGITAGGDFSSTSTSYVPITNLTSTFACPGTPIFVLVSLPCYSTGAASVSFALAVDGTVVTAALGIGSSSNSNTVAFFGVLSPSLGAHTIAVYGHTSGGTFYINMSSVQNGTMLVFG